MPDSGDPAGVPWSSAISARTAIASAEAAISITWNSEASASALPCPKR